MYVHLGQDTVVWSGDILGVFDMDNSTVSRHTRGFLALAQKEGRVVNVSMELPKSYIVCSHQDRLTVYISQIAPATLLRRIQRGPERMELK